jgi:D-isomer specific 2-hydroxyacid dehydrogenase-like protein
MARTRLNGCICFAHRRAGGPSKLGRTIVVRAAHPDLSMRVTEYVVLHTLRYHRRRPLYDAQQRERVWRVPPQPAASEVNVGVMGLGMIGSEAARVLARIGFKVAAWRARAKQIEGVQTFHGPNGLDAFLGRTEILICLLPLTADTRGILNRDRVPDQCWTRRPAGRRRHSRRSRRRHAGGRDPRRVPARTASARQPVLVASEGDGHAA